MITITLNQKSKGEVLTMSKIKYHRKKLNLTSRELEKLSGVGYADICRYERGKTTPTVVTLQKLAKALNVTVNELI